MLPELEWGGHLTEMLMEVGPSEAGMNGPEPVAWREIHAWADLTGAVLHDGEASLVRELSREYCNAFHECNGVNAAPPAEFSQTQREKAGQQFAALVRRFSEKPE